MLRTSFQMSLLVIDECHYATGKHNYATILQKFYHTLSQDDRPRILGLTASPLINVTVGTSDEKLQSLLTNFENMVDARLVGFPNGSSSKSDVYQAVVEYTSTDNISLPTSSGWKLHSSREKEINQLQILLNDVGPRVTAVYASTLAREVSRNEYEQESPQEWENLKSYLRRITNYLDQYIADGNPEHTDKMGKLESLLESVLKLDESPVGIVFVEMRITAIALNTYFFLKSKGQIMNTSGSSTQTGFSSGGVFADAENDKMVFRAVCGGATTESNRTLIRCDVAVRKPTHVFKYLSKKFLDEHQQQVLEDDWIHQTTQIRSIISKLRHRETNVLFSTSIVEEVCSSISLFMPIHALICSMLNAIPIGSRY